VSASGELAPGTAPTPGVVPTTPTLRVRTLRSLEGVAADPRVGPSPSRATDVRPYVMILCSFPDYPYDMLPKSRYDVLLGPTRPNMGHYFGELSFGRLSLAGSVSVGWFTLKNPFLHYYPNGGQSLRFWELLNDCTAAADPSVDFTRYSGIIVQHNAGTGWAFGGRYTLALDGQARSYGVAWMPRSGPAQLAHEIGHSLGFPHSSGGYDQVYDSRWDVMSNPYGFTDYSLNPPDYLQQHTIAYNKWWAGWIDSDRLLVPSLPSTRSVMLLYGDRAPTTAGHQLVRVTDPVTSSKSYMAEARRRVGYDQGVPGDAVVLHSFDPTRLEPAQVIDVDQNADPNDAGAMWTPGESYSDSVAGVTIDVDSTNASGFGVTVVRGWRLRMRATGPGAITGAPTGPCTAECDHVAAARGAAVTLSAKPDAGAQFVGWSGSCTGTGACAVTLAGNRVVGATFALPVSFTAASERPRAIVGRPYADKLVATGGTGSMSWAVTSGTLPPGLALAPSTGVLSGQPTTQGKFEFTVTATSGTLTNSRSFVIVAVRPVAIATASALPRAVTGSEYTHTLAADGGVGTMSWSVSAGALPAGLALESTSGRLAGTPTVAGNFEFTVTAASDTLRDARKFTLPIVAAVAITSTSVRRGAIMGAAYADTLRASGGNAAFDWRVVVGALPAGLSLAPNGVLSGIPTASGASRFTAIATSDGLSAQREFELTVSKPSVAASAVLEQLLGVSSTLTTDERSFLDLLGNRNGRVDIGDVRAWLVDVGALPAGAPPSASLSALDALRGAQAHAPGPTRARTSATSQYRARP
jgi:M6 family metalloprotease-like protein